MGLIDAASGWARVDDRLVWTTNFGADWSTVYDLGAWPLLRSGEVGFLDGNDGWAIDRADAAAPRFESTTDGGRTWVSTALPSGRGTPSRPAFLDTGHAILVMYGGEGAPGALLVTDNGGRTWQIKATTPAGVMGPIALLGPSDWVAEGTSDPRAPTGPMRDSLFVTHDAGFSWERVDIPVSGTGGTVVGMTVPLPVSPFAGANAIAAVDVLRQTSSQTEIVITTDGGRSWTVAGGLPGDSAGAPLEVVAADDWLASLPVAGEDQPALERSTDEGRSWTRVPTQGLPSTSAIRTLDFADATVGWALVDVAPSSSVGSGAPGQLFATTDGGLHWFSIQPGPP